MADLLTALQSYLGPLDILHRPLQQPHAAPLDASGAPPALAPGDAPARTCHHPPPPASPTESTLAALAHAAGVRPDAWGACANDLTVDAAVRQPARSRRRACRLITDGEPTPDSPLCAWRQPRAVHPTAGHLSGGLTPYRSSSSSRPGQPSRRSRAVRAVLCLPVTSPELNHPALWQLTRCIPSARRSHVCRPAAHLGAIHADRREERHGMTSPPAHSSPDTVTKIAQALEETSSQSIATIRRIVTVCGTDQALRWLQEAQRIQAAGGMLTDDGTRLRTPGGLYFKIVKDALLHAGDRQRVYEIFWFRPRRAATDQPAPLPPPSPTAWAERAALWDTVAPGEAATLTLTITGRPDVARIDGRQARLMLAYDRPLTAFPRGVPLPTRTPITVYDVALGAAHARAIAERDPARLVRLAGTGFLDPRLGGMVALVREPPMLLEHDERIAPGQARSAKLLVSGTVGTPLVRHDCTLIKLIHRRPPPNLPKGLQAPSPYPPTTISLSGFRATRHVGHQK